MRWRLSEIAGYPKLPRSIGLSVRFFPNSAATPTEQASKSQALQLNWELAIADSRERPSQQLPARILQMGNGELIAAGSRIVPLSRRGPGETTLLDTKAMILDAVG